MTIKSGTMVIIKYNAAPGAMILTDNQIVPVLAEDIPFVLHRFGRKKTKPRERKLHDNRV